MDNQDQRNTHTHTAAAGHESHGVHLCHNCGWPFPNPHPSSKHRRAHKKICGTIEGYKLSVTEGQHHLNGSDDDHNTPGLVVSGPNSLETGNNEMGNEGNGDKLFRSEDDVFSDAVADFSDSGSNQEIKERLQDSLDSGADVERVDIKEPKFSGSSEDKDFNAADASKLNVKSTDDSQIQNPNVLQNESVEAGNTVELKGQLSSPTVDSLSSSIADSRTEESTIVDSDVFFGLSSDLPPSEAEAMPDILPEKNIYAGENVTDSSLVSVAKETNLKEKDEVNSAKDVVEIVKSPDSDNVVGETFEGVSKTAVSNVVSLDHQVSDGAVHLKEKNGAEINSNRDVVEIVESSDKVVGETSEEVSKTAVSDVVSLDHQVGEGAVYPKEKNGADFLSLLPPDNLPRELNLVVITKDAQGESVNVVQFATSSDDKILLEKGEGNVYVDLLPTRDDGPDEEHPESEYGDFKDHGVVYQNPFLCSYDPLKHEGGELSQLGEKTDVLSPDIDVVDSVKMELVNNEPTPKEMHAGECFEVSPVKLAVESNQRSHEIDTSVNAMKTEMEVNHMGHISEEHGSDDVYRNSQQISLPEGSLMASSNESQRDESSGSATGETISVINIDSTSHHEEKGTEINEVALDGKVVGANVENDIEIILKDLQHGDILQSEVKQSDYLLKSDAGKSDAAGKTGKNEQYAVPDAQFKESPIVSDTSLPKSATIHFETPGISESSDYLLKSDAGKSDAAGETGKNEQYDVPDAQFKESPIVNDTSLPKSTTIHFETPIIAESSDVVVDGPANKSNGTECRNIDSLSGTQEDIKEDEINISSKLNEEYSNSADTSVVSHQAQDAELLVKAEEDLARKYTSPLTTEPSAQNDSSVDDSTGGEPGREVSGITAVSVQDQTVNSLGKLSSSGVAASVDSGSRCDSLEGNWGSVSVLSMQSDAPAVIDAETLPSTGSLASTEAVKSNSNNPKAASERQQSGKSEMFEPPSFMTLVDPKQVSPKAAASEVQKGQNSQQPDSTSQAAWFPTLTQVVNESQGRKKNEEIIAKVTNWSTSKEHTPLKSLLGEAAHSNKPISPKMEENSASQKSSKVPENNGSGLTTVNSILGPESPVAQGVKGEAAKEWNSPARYPADIKREKRKARNRPYWIQLVCCTSVGPDRR